MPKTTRTASKPVKIILLAVLGLAVVISVVAITTSKKNDGQLIDGLRAVDPALVSDESQAVDRANSVCAAGVTVPNIMGAFFVERGTAGRLTVPLGAFCAG